MYTSIVTIYVCVCGGGGCGISLLFYISCEIKGFQDLRLFPIFTLEFNRRLRNLNFSISTSPAQGRGGGGGVMQLLSGKTIANGSADGNKNPKPRLRTILHLP